MILEFPVIFILEIRIEISSSQLAQIGASRAVDRKDAGSNTTFCRFFFFLIGGKKWLSPDYIIP